MYTHFSPVSDGEFGFHIIFLGGDKINFCLVLCWSENVLDWSSVNCETLNRQTVFPIQVLRTQLSFALLNGSWADFF